MIIFKYLDQNGTFIEVNFCESGLYVKIDEEAGDAYTMTMQNIIIDNDAIEELKRYLNGQTSEE